MNRSARERALLGCLLTAALSAISCGTARAAPAAAPEVHRVAVCTNRWRVLVSGRAACSVSVDTARYQEQSGKAMLKVGAWAYDRSNNLGKAKPIAVLVDNQPNATPAKPDPARVPDSHPVTGPEAAVPMASPVLAPSAAQAGGGALRQSEPASRGSSQQPVRR